MTDTTTETAIENEAAQRQINPEVLQNISVTLSIEVGRAMIKIRDLMRLTQGSVVELDRIAGEPLDLLVNNTVVAQGEIVLVNDGSPDGTADVCRELVKNARVPITYVEHARNFGEHNAVLTGWRNARGAHLVNLDDDGQNPPVEAVRLWRHAQATGLDVVFGHYAVKQHSAWRNLGSWFTNRMTDWALDKPPGFYLSSFRCVTAFVAKEVVGYPGPYPYIDGLLLQVTQRLQISAQVTLRQHVLSTVLSNSFTVTSK